MSASEPTHHWQQAGEFILFRDAVRMFASKDEIAALNVSLRSIVTRVDDLVPRTEHDLHWKIEDQRYEDIRQQMQRDRDEVRGSLERIEKVLGASEDKHDAALREIQANRLPKWFLPVAAIIVPVVMGTVILIVSHYWR